MSSSLRLLLEGISVMLPRTYLVVDRKWAKQQSATETVVVAHTPTDDGRSPFRRCSIVIRHHHNSTPWLSTLKWKIPQVEMSCPSVEQKSLLASGMDFTFVLSCVNCVSPFFPSFDTRSDPSCLPASPPRTGKARVERGTDGALIIQR